MQLILSWLPECNTRWIKGFPVIHLLKATSQSNFFSLFYLFLMAVSRAIELKKVVGNCCYLPWSISVKSAYRTFLKIGSDLRKLALKGNNILEITNCRHSFVVYMSKTSYSAFQNSWCNIIASFKVLLAVRVWVSTV